MYLSTLAILDYFLTQSLTSVAWNYIPWYCQFKLKISKKRLGMFFLKYYVIEFQRLNQNCLTGFEIHLFNLIDFRYFDVSCKSSQFQMLG